MVNLIPFGAIAAEITILEDRRYVLAEAGYFVDSSYTFDHYSDSDEAYANAPFFDESVRMESSWWSPDGELIGWAEASQTSTVGPNGIVARVYSNSSNQFYSGSGGDPNDEGSYWWERSEAWGSAQSNVRVVFSVSETISYHISGWGDGFGLSLNVGPNFYLADRVFLVNNLSTDEDGTFSFHGTLAPGTYRLSANGDYDFAFLVPEPGTLLLVGAGLAALASRSPRRRVRAR